jgi:hypothetical protein
VRKWERSNQKFVVDTTLIFPSLTQDLNGITTFTIDGAVFIALGAYRGYHRVMRRNGTQFVLLSTPTHNNTYGSPTHYFTYQ